MEREVSEQIKKPQRPQSRECRATARKAPNADVGLAGKAAAASECGRDATPGAADGVEAASVDDKNAVFKSGTQRPQSAGGGVRRRNNSQEEQYQCARTSGTILLDY